MKKTNKILSFILAILIVLSIIPITASAATPTSGTCGENVTWEFDKSTDTLFISGTGAMNNNYTYYNRPWESYEDDIEKVIINKGVTTIGRYAFYDCNYITSVTIHDSVRFINDYAFEYCESLTNIIIPNSVVTIGDLAFFDCMSLTSVTIPDSVIEIGEEAFSYCTSLTSITLSNNITAINYCTFSDCTNLKSVTIPEGVEIIRESAFHGCENLTNVTIPDSVTIIGVDAFEDCESITDVYYSGTEEQWKQISIKAYNWDLTGAAIHYNSTGADTHPYRPVVTLPTCTEQGYTTYICACGYSNNVVDNYVDATGHSHTSEITTPATHTATGVMTYTCACGDSYTEVIEKIAEHDYESVVTLPTCTKQGYTTYTCECGDSYVDDYIDATGHLYGDWVVTKEPTTDTEGEMERVCSCGEKEYKSIDKLPPVENNDIEQENTNKENVERPEIPNTDYSIRSSEHILFVVAIFICVIFYAIPFRKKIYNFVSGVEK